MTGQSHVVVPLRRRASAPAVKPEVDTGAPLKILMVCARYFPFMGGIETHIHEVATRLAAQGHAVTILTTDPGGKWPPEEMVGGVHVVRVKAYPKNRDYYIAPQIASSVMNGDWDIVHVQGYHTAVPPLAMVAAHRRNIPFVVTFHSGGHSSGFRNLLRAPQRALLAPIIRKAAQLIGVSEFEADFFSRTMGVPREQFTVVPNGAQLPEVAPASPDAEPNTLILSIGRLERYKGHHRAIQAYAKLRAHRPDLKLRILGEGPYRSELEALVRKLGLNGNVYIGGIPSTERKQMAELLSRAAVVLLLSDYEAHPVAVMEALSLKKPVIVTDCTGFREMAARDLVRSVPLSSEPEQVARAILDELNSPHPIPDIELPSWDDCAANLLAIYRRVLERKGALAGGIRHVPLDRPSQPTTA